MDGLVEDFLVTDPVSGKRTRYARTVRRALEAMLRSGTPFSVVGAAALAARGLPRMTRDLNLVVPAASAPAAMAALRDSGFAQQTPAGSAEEPEAMVVFADAGTGIEVNLLVAIGNPEAMVIDDAPAAELFGVSVPVATLEHVLLLYLYSNQPKHLGDFAAIVRSGRADIDRTTRLLAAMHPEMLGDWRQRLAEARSPRPAPPRPSRRGPR